MKNIKALVEYRGTAYHGFQVQPGLRTIQGELERALSASLMEDIRLVGAGRTDAGVHALGQVISFETGTKVHTGNIARLVNYKLPSDIALVSLEEVAGDFSARFSARSKLYRYIIHNRKTPSGLYHDMTYHVHQKLDIDRMRRAVQPLIGEMDYSSFMGRDSTVPHAVREIYSIGIERFGDRIEIDFHGRAFLRNMIRIIVGSLVDIGRGKEDVDFLARALEKKSRIHAGYTAPASGLYLMEVRY